ncbi:MAG: DUF1963 domain-containing protein [Oscillospiraceae bacterium]|nr:DUF1963 domain-containing protein [Oscillospiraceae bacterium]
MTNEQALQYAQYAAKKALAELDTQYAVHFALQEEVPSVFHSKIGGKPYFPAGAEIPVDRNGEQLRFLMQINCSEVQGIGCFPKQGMIQFWICADDCWGMWDDDRVIYYDTISESSTEPPVSAFNDVEKEFFPLKGEFGVAFLPTVEDTPKDSIRYQRTFCKYFNEISGESIESPYDLEFKLHLPFEVLAEALYNNNSSHGHKIGGSSDFCQYDPRETEEQQERYDFQLLQLCSDFGRIDGKNFARIMWGDAGICHFFINSEKLKNCDFSDILYYCDCC